MAAAATASLSRHHHHALPADGQFFIEADLFLRETACDRCAIVFKPPEIALDAPDIRGQRRQILIMRRLGGLKAALVLRQCRIRRLNFPGDDRELLARIQLFVFRVVNFTQERLIFNIIADGQHPLFVARDALFQGGAQVGQFSALEFEILLAG